MFTDSLLAVSTGFFCNLPGICQQNSPLSHSDIDFIDLFM